MSDTGSPPNPETSTDEQTPDPEVIEQSANGESQATSEETNPNQNGEAEVTADIKQDDESEATEEKPQEEKEEGGLINATEDNESKMFVGGLSWDTETFGLRDYFSKYGEVKDCIIKKDSKTERSRGFGFVLFANSSSVQKVIDCPSHYLDGRKIDPKRALAQKKDGKLFVGGISPETDDEVVKEYFTKFGEIEAYERPKDRTTKKPRGFCFITFKKDGILKKVCAEKHQTLDGASVEVKEAQSQDKGQQPGMARGGGFMGRGGWMGGNNFYGPGYGYGPAGYGYDMGYEQGYGGGGFVGGYAGPASYGNFASGGFPGGAYGGGGKTAKAREGSARHRGGGWGDTQTRSSHTNWYGHRGNFHGAYQGFHEY